GYGQSVPAMPMLRLSVLAVLADIGLGTARSARWIHAEVLRRHPLLQAHDFSKTQSVSHTCVNLGLATTPQQQPEHSGPSRFGLRLAAGLDRAMVEYARQDPSIAPLGIGLEAIEVPGDVIAAVTDGLGSEVEEVLIQSDLTAVATGPIEPRGPHIRRRYAVVGARGQGTGSRTAGDTTAARMRAAAGPRGRGPRRAPRRRPGRPRRPPLRSGDAAGGSRKAGSDGRDRSAGTGADDAPARGRRPSRPAPLRDRAGSQATGDHPVR